jgi:hypothetical protein
MGWWRVMKRTRKVPRVDGSVQDDRRRATAFKPVRKRWESAYDFNFFSKNDSVESLPRDENIETEVMKKKRQTPLWRG